MVRNDSKTSQGIRTTPRRSWPGLTSPTSHIGFCQGYFCPWQSSPSLIAGPCGALSPTWKVGTSPSIQSLVPAARITCHGDGDGDEQTRPPELCSFCALKIRAEASSGYSRLAKSERLWTRNSEMRLSFGGNQIWVQILADSCHHRHLSHWHHRPHLCWALWSHFPVSFICPVSSQGIEAWNGY